MKYLFFLALVVFGNPLLSQNLTEIPLDTIVSNKSGLLDEVIIQENRLKTSLVENSKSIAVITQKEIQTLRANSLNEVLQIIPGLDLKQRGIHGVQADLSIRGGTFEQSLVLLNGVRMLDPQTGHHLMNIPVHTEDIERIEIIKGPAARVFGQNAFAGAINIITKPSEKKLFRIAGEYGSFDQRNGYAQLALPIGKYRQSFSLGYNSADGYRDNTDYNILNGYYQSHFELGNGGVNIYAGYVDKKFGANGFYGNETFTEQYEEVATKFASVSLNQGIGEWDMTLRGSLRINDDNWQFRRSDPAFFQNYHTTKVYISELHASRKHRSGEFGVGIEYNNLNLESSNLKDSSGNGNHSRNQLGLHLENRFSLLNHRMDITPGVFLLAVTEEEFQVLPGLDLGYRFSDELKLFANLGATSRVPSFTDLYYKDRGNEGNPDLTQEKAFSTELGMTYNTSDVDLQMSLFIRNATDQIDWYRASDTLKWTPDNFSSAEHYGLDLTVGTSLQSVDYIDLLKVGYNYIKAEFQENDFQYSRNQLENLRHQLILNANFILGPMNLGFLFKYNDRVSLENYSVFDATLSYSIDGVTVYAKGNNLLNAEYRETNLVPMPRRWFKTGLSYVFM